jgi:hypothetical protein
MPTRIYEALAIEQRLLSPIEEGCADHRAIENARRALLALKIERVVVQRTATLPTNGRTHESA